MVLLDIKSAFDSVWHSGIVSKLKRIIKIIQNFLCDRYSSVHISTTISQKISITAECPQGSYLSPVLYNIFTADIPIFHCVTSIFADDTAILSSDEYAVNIVANLELALQNLKT